MKKIIFIIISLLMVSTFVACDSPKTVKEQYIENIKKNGEDFSFGEIKGKAIKREIEDTTTTVYIGNMDETLFLIEECKISGFENDLTIVAIFDEIELNVDVSVPIRVDEKEELLKGHVIIDPLTYKKGDDVLQISVDSDDNIHSFAKEQIQMFAVSTIDSMDMELKEFNGEASVKDIGFKVYLE